MNFNMMHGILHFISTLIFVTFILIGVSCLLVASGRILIDYYFKSKEACLNRLSEDTLRRIVQQDEQRVN